MGREKLFKDEEIQILKGLGLTFCEAKVYLALVKLGASPVKSISKVSILHDQTVTEYYLHFKKEG